MVTETIQCKYCGADNPLAEQWCIRCGCALPDWKSRLASEAGQTEKELASIQRAIDKGQKADAVISRHSEESIDRARTMLLLDRNRKNTRNIGWILVVILIWLIIWFAVWAYANRFLL